MKLFHRWIVHTWASLILRILWLANTMFTEAVDFTVLASFQSKGCPPEESDGHEETKAISVDYLLPNAAGQFGYLVVGGLLLGHLLVDLAIGMHHGGVVTAAKDLANFG